MNRIKKTLLLSNMTHFYLDTCTIREILIFFEDFSKLISDRKIFYKSGQMLSNSSWLVSFESYYHYSYENTQDNHFIVNQYIIVTKSLHPISEFTWLLFEKTVFFLSFPPNKWQVLTFFLFLIACHETIDNKFIAVSGGLF